MANKKLRVGGASDLKLPAKKSKDDKKPKWQAKTGGKKGKAEPVVELPSVVDEQAPVVDQPVDVPGADTMPAEAAPLEESPALESAPESTPTGEPTPDPESTPAKPKKLKVKADIAPKKLSMIKAALQVLQERKVAMTCPEMIDVMATEGLWTSPGGKTQRPRFMPPYRGLSKTWGRSRSLGRRRKASLKPSSSAAN